MEKKVFEYQLPGDENEFFFLDILKEILLFVILTLFMLEKNHYQKMIFFK